VSPISGPNESSHADLGLVLRALAFAAHRHRRQLRKGSDPSPYINHPIAVANVLVNEGNVHDTALICAALLHDTIEDTETTAAELEAEFGAEIARIVQELTDDKSLPPETRKRLQIEHAPSLSRGARLVKLADKTCNLRDLGEHPPTEWPLERRQRYFDWAEEVVRGLRGVSPALEAAFDAAWSRRPR
jgi:guanosine-3',5'-bis(diphosphate) 3'-pyrophosphohydrolase